MKFGLWMTIFLSVEQYSDQNRVVLSDTLPLEDKFCYEKIHNKFCKYILCLKKIACNISAKSELGRFPITDYIKT